MNKKISLFSLIVLIIASIDNIRNLPSAAMFGSSMIFFFILSAIVFLLPTSLVAAELSSLFPDKGGVFHWVNKAFGKKWGMLAIWLQWINTMVWYPTILSFIAGTLAYTIDPALAMNKTFLISTVLTIFWGLTFINLLGLPISALVTNICAILGTIAPLMGLIALGGIWIWNGHPLQMEITTETIIPPLSNSTSWVSLIAIMASFLGMELAGVHVNDIKNPQKNFPRAVLLACLFIFLSMVLGSLSIAYVLPGKEISLVSGVMQTFENFFEAFGLQKMVPVLALSIAIGSIGTMTNWLISPAKGLLHAAEFDFLPSFFTHKNKAGVASNILLAQAILVTLFCTAFLFVQSINAFYWFFTALSTELYMIMYLLMFAAGIKLHYQYTERAASFKIPGGQFGIWTISLLGLLGCIATIVISFFPPDNFDIGSSSHYLSLISVANLITICPVFLFFLYEKKKRSVLVTDQLTKGVERFAHEPIE